MKKFLGLIFYILSLLLTICWLWSIEVLLFDNCDGLLIKNSACVEIIARTPIWQNTTGIIFIVITPIIAFIFYKIGKKLRK